MQNNLDWTIATSESLQQMFSGGNNRFPTAVGGSRATWLNWAVSFTSVAVSNFDNQPNCNRTGINANGAYDGARIGWTGNNENDCNTNDSSVGFGCMGGEVGAGARTWSPSTSYFGYGTLWVK
jgi:hypothetical protein